MAIVNRGYHSLFSLYRTVRMRMFPQLFSVPRHFRLDSSLSCYPRHEENLFRILLTKKLLSKKKNQLLWKIKTKSLATRLLFRVEEKVQFLLTNSRDYQNWVEARFTATPLTRSLYSFPLSQSFSHLKNRSLRKPRRQWERQRERH